MHFSQEMHRFVKIFVCVLVVIVLSTYVCKAQRIAVSTNAIEWVALSPNLGFEIAIERHHAFSMTASASPWAVSKRLSVEHITLIPEYKYWFDMPFFGHYVGANLLYSSYNITGSSSSRMGNLVAAGVNYGYSFILGKKWNVVPFAGVGIGVDGGDVTSFAPLVARLGVNFQIVVK